MAARVLCVWGWAERVAAGAAAGRTVAATVVSAERVPPFPASMVDGYAVAGPLAVGAEVRVPRCRWPQLLLAAEEEGADDGGGARSLRLSGSHTRVRVSRASLQRARRVHAPPPAPTTATTTTTPPPPPYATRHHYHNHTPPHNHHHLPTTTTITTWSQS